MVEWKRESWAITDIGKRREHNEDSYLCNDDLGLYVVADGMGGHKAGDVASQLAVREIEQTISAKMNQVSSDIDEGSGTRMMFVDGGPIQDLLTKSVQAASSAILDEIENDNSLSGMGTTTTLLYFQNENGYYAHVGDSRLYRLQDGKLSHISTDHSFVQEQVDAGLMTEDEANNSQYKNIITRSVGFERNTQVDVGQIDLKSGDLFLLCSDGLSNMLDDSELKDILLNKEPEVALSFFINLANSRGGDDNITIVIVRLTEPAE